MQPNLSETVSAGLRVAGASLEAAEAPCCLCRATGCAWDQVADRPICFDCQIELMNGHIDSLKFSLDPNRCLICSRTGTTSHLSFPLGEPEHVAIDLCSKHLNALVARRLKPKAYRRLRARLNRSGFAVEQFYLLHEAFYDEQGVALQPIE